MDNPYDHLQACFSALIKVEERTHNKYRTLGAKVRLTCKSEKEFDEQVSLFEYMFVSVIFYFVILLIALALLLYCYISETRTARE